MPRPRIYGGGESVQARDVVSQFADVFFINGRPASDAAGVLDDIRLRDRDGRPPLDFAMAAFVVARETDEEAADALRDAFALAALDAGDEDRLYRAADPQSTMFKFLESTPHIGTNGGTHAGLVGLIRDGRRADPRVRGARHRPADAPVPAVRGRDAEHVVPRVRAEAPVRS